MKVSHWAGRMILWGIAGFWCGWGVVYGVGVMDVGS